MLLVLTGKMPRAECKLRVGGGGRGPREDTRSIAVGSILHKFRATSDSMVQARQVGCVHPQDEAGENHKYYIILVMQRLEGQGRVKLSENFHL